MKPKTIELPVIPEWLTVYINEVNNNDNYCEDSAFNRYEKILSDLHFANSTYENSKEVVDKCLHVSSLKELLNRINWIDNHRDDTIIAIKYGYEVEDD